MLGGNQGPASGESSVKAGAGVEGELLWMSWFGACFDVAAALGGWQLSRQPRPCWPWAALCALRTARLWLRARGIAVVPVVPSGFWQKGQGRGSGVLRSRPPVPAGLVPPVPAGCAQLWVPLRGGRSPSLPRSLG